MHIIYIHTYIRTYIKRSTKCKRGVQYVQHVNVWRSRQDVWCDCAVNLRIVDFPELGLASLAEFIHSLGDNLRGFFTECQKD